MSDKVREALRNLLQWAEGQVCMHDETHRGGAIWEICDMCGAKWADDEGGKPDFKWPQVIEDARAAPQAQEQAAPQPVAWMRKGTKPEHGVLHNFAMSEPLGDWTPLYASPVSAPQVSELPPLPDYAARAWKKSKQGPMRFAVSLADWFTPTDVTDLFTADQLLEYGKQCALLSGSVEQDAKPSVDVEYIEGAEPFLRTMHGTFDMGDLSAIEEALIEHAKDNTGLFHETGTYTFQVSWNGAETYDGGRYVSVPAYWDFHEVAFVADNAAMGKSADASVEQDAKRYEDLEREHLGDPIKKTGIYSERQGNG